MLEVNETAHRVSLFLSQLELCVETRAEGFFRKCSNWCAWAQHDGKTFMGLLSVERPSTYPLLDSRDGQLS